MIFLYFKSFVTSAIRLVLVLLVSTISISSCKTTSNHSTNKLSAISDPKYRLSLIRISNFSSNNNTKPHLQHYQFLVCLNDRKDHCTKVFKTASDDRLALSIINFFDLKSSLSLTNSEFHQLDVQMRADGFISDWNNYRIRSNDFWIQHLNYIVNSDEFRDLGLAGLGASALIIKHELSTYNVDTLNSRISASARISRLNDILFNSQQVFKRNQDDKFIQLVNALNHSYSNSIEISPMFIDRDREYSQIFQELAKNKHIKTQSDHIIESFSQKTIEVDRKFLTDIKQKITSLQENTKTLASQTTDHSLLLNEFYLKTNKNLENLEKTVSSSVDTHGNIKTKKIFNALCDYYFQLADTHINLANKLLKNLDKNIHETFIELNDDFKFLIQLTKNELNHHAEVLRKWYSKPYFHRSNFDSVGRIINHAVIKSAKGLQAIEDSAEKLTTGPKKAYDNLFDQATKLVNKKLAKPLMIIVGTIMSGGVIINGFNQYTNDSADHQQSDLSDIDLKKAEYSLFYQHLNHTLTTNPDANKSVESVEEFVNQFAKFLNTNLFYAESEKMLKISSICLPTQTKGQEFCTEISS